MIENSYVNKFRSTEVSLDIDFDPYQNARMRNSAVKSRETVPTQTTALLPDCDVDRIIRYFRKQS